MRTDGYSRLQPSAVKPISLCRGTSIKYEDQEYLLVAHHLGLASCKHLWILFRSKLPQPLVRRGIQTLRGVRGSTGKSRPPFSSCVCAALGETRPGLVLLVSAIHRRSREETGSFDPALCSVRQKRKREFNSEKKEKKKTCEAGATMGAGEQILHTEQNPEHGADSCPEPHHLPHGVGISGLACVTTAPGQAFC